MLKLANNLSLPVDAVTQAFAILGRRGSGKTNTAVVMAEQMLAASFPVVILDPLGVWWGLRSSASGSGAGYPVAIFGGEHGDVPLEPTAGKVVADFIVSNRLPVILDLFHFGENDMRRFVSDFAKQFYRTNREAIHWFVDEADEFAPQSPSGGPGAECLGAMQNIVRRGRAKGIGVTLITQRSAVLNKSVLTQTECLVAMQTTGPHDLKAIDEWIKYHGTAEEREKIMRSLTALQQGDAWVYSPAWLKLLKQVHVNARTTFDSSRTPKPGEARQQPKRVADVNLSLIQKQMAATVENAKANDPRELKRKIAELQKQLAGKGADPGAIAAAEDRGRKQGRAEVEGELRQLRAAIGEREGRLSKIESLAHLNGAAQKIGATVPKPPVSRPVSSHVVKPQRSVDGTQVSIGKGERRILIAIAQHGDAGVTREQLTVLTGYKRSSRDTYLQHLRQAELIDDGETIIATSAGLDALGADFEPLPTGLRLCEYWFDNLPTGERELLSELVKVYPDSLTRDELSELTDYKRSSRDTYLQRLRSRRLIDVRGSNIGAAEILFD